MSGGGGDTETAYSALRRDLDKFGFKETLSFESLNLVRHLFKEWEQKTAALIRVTEKANYYSKISEELEEGVAPFKEENVRLIKENCELRLAVLRAQENAEETILGSKSRLRDLESENHDLKLLVKQFVKRTKTLEFESLEKSNKIGILLERSAQGAVVISEGKTKPTKPKMNVQNYPTPVCPHCVRIKNYIEYGNKYKDPTILDYAKLTDSRIEALQIQNRNLKSEKDQLDDKVIFLKKQVEGRESEIHKLKGLIEVRPGGLGMVKGSSSGDDGRFDRELHLALRAAQMQLEILQSRNLQLEKKLQSNILDEHSKFMGNGAKFPKKLSRDMLESCLVDAESGGYPTHDKMTLEEKVRLLEAQLSHCCKEKAKLKILLEECEERHGRRQTTPVPVRDSRPSREKIHFAEKDSEFKSTKGGRDSNRVDEEDDELGSFFDIDDSGSEFSDEESERLDKDKKSGVSKEDSSEKMEERKSRSDSNGPRPPWRAGVSTTRTSSTSVGSGRGSRGRISKTNLQTRSRPQSRPNEMSSQKVQRGSRSASGGTRQRSLTSDAQSRSGPPRRSDETNQEIKAVYAQLKDLDDRFERAKPGLKTDGETDRMLKELRELKRDLAKSQGSLQKEDDELTGVDEQRSSSNVQPRQPSTASRSGIHVQQRVPSESRQQTQRLPSREEILDTESQVPAQRPGRSDETNEELKALHAQLRELDDKMERAKPGLKTDGETDRLLKELGKLKKDLAASQGSLQKWQDEEEQDGQRRQPSTDRRLGQQRVPSDSRQGTQRMPSREEIEENEEGPIPIDQQKVDKSNDRSSKPQIQVEKSKADMDFSHAEEPSEEIKALYARLREMDEKFEKNKPSLTDGNTDRLEKEILRLSKELTENQETQRRQLEAERTDDKINKIGRIPSETQQRQSSTSSKLKVPQEGQMQQMRLPSRERTEENLDNSRKEEFQAQRSSEVEQYKAVIANLEERLSQSQSQLMLNVQPGRSDESNAEIQALHARLRELDDKFNKSKPSLTDGDTDRLQKEIQKLTKELKESQADAQRAARRSMERVESDRLSPSRSVQRTQQPSSSRGQSMERENEDGLRGQPSESIRVQWRRDDDLGSQRLEEPTSSRVSLLSRERSDLTQKYQGLPSREREQSLEREKFDIRIELNQKDGLLAKYQNEIAQYKIDISNLQQRLARAESQFGRPDDATGEIRSLTNRLRELESKLDRARLDLKDGDTQRSNLEKEIRRLSQDLKESQGEAQRWRQEAQRTGDRLEETERLLTEVQRRQTTALSTLSLSAQRDPYDLTQQYQRLSTREQSLEREIISLKSGLKALDRDKDDMRIELDRKDERLLKYQNEVEQYKTDISNLQHRLATAELQLGHTGETTREQERETMLLRRQVESLRRDLEHMMKERDGCLEDLRKVSQTHSMGEVERRSMSFELDKRNKETDELKKQLQKYIDEVRRFEDLLLRKEEEYNLILEQYRTLSEEHNSLESQRQNLEQKADSIRREVRETIGQNATLKSKLTSQSSLVKSYEDEIERLSHQVASLETQLGSVSSAEKTLQNESSSTRELCLRLEANLDKTRLDLANSMSAQRKLEAENQDLRAHVERLEAEMTIQIDNSNRLEELIAKTREKEFAIQRSVQDLKTDRDEQSRTTEVLQSRVESLTQEVSKYRIKCTELQTELERTRRQLTNEIYERENAMAELRRLQDQLNTSSTHRLLGTFDSSGASRSISPSPRAPMLRVTTEQSLSQTSPLSGLRSPRSRSFSPDPEVPMSSPQGMSTARGDEEDTSTRDRLSER